MDVSGPGGSEARRYPLLPPGTGLGWTPYAWLIYLGSFLWWPATGAAEPWEIAGTFAVAAAFVPLYFWGYWQTGRRALMPAAGMALLGTFGALWTPMAGIFYIYGSGYAGPAHSARWGGVIIGGLLAWLAVVSAVLDPHRSYWILGGVFTLLIGGINLHFGLVAKKDARLRRSHEEIERLAQIAERERIGRDLHDLLGHTLSLITLKAELADKLFDRDPGAARREVGEIEGISRQALEEVREAVAGYRESGLKAEIERAERALRSAGVACDRRRVEEAALAVARSDPQTESALAFVVREAVTNVLRHADANRCEMRLELSGDGLMLEVVDDGRGGSARDGFGLTGLRERVVALGGRLEREGGQGTRLTVRVPVGAVDRPDDSRDRSPVRTSPLVATEGAG